MFSRTSVSDSMIAARSFLILLLFLVPYSPFVFPDSTSPSSFTLVLLLYITCTAATSTSPTSSVARLCVSSIYTP